MGRRPGKRAHACASCGRRALGSVVCALHRLACLLPHASRRAAHMASPWSSSHKGAAHGVRAGPGARAPLQRRRRRQIARMRANRLAAGRAAQAAARTWAAKRGPGMRGGWPATSWFCLRVPVHWQCARESCRKTIQWEGEQCANGAGTRSGGARVAVRGVRPAGGLFFEAPGRGRAAAGGGARRAPPQPRGRPARARGEPRTGQELGNRGARDVLSRSRRGRGAPGNVDERKREGVARGSVRGSAVKPKHGCRHWRRATAAPA
jgi:hypothetical protein